jgi:tetratricopeptide (TPR) repeat protein
VHQYRESLAATHDYLGNLLKELGKRDEARREFEAALGLLEPLADAFPSVPRYQIDLGGSYCNLGNLVRDEGKPADSLPWFDLAIRTLTPVHEKDPRVATARQFLRNSHWGRARAYDRLKKHAEAVKDWDRAVELSPKQEQPYYRASRVNSRLLAGQVAEAVAEVEELTKTTKWTALQCYNFACVYAVASGKLAGKKPEYADRAMTLLNRAVKSGYNNAAHMAKDTDLDPLRSREDFQKLLADLSARGDKKP